jgi:hypothetical protein
MLGIIFALLISTAQAQELVPKGIPQVTLDEADKPIALEAISKLRDYLLSQHDGESALRLHSVAHNVALADTIDPRNVPFLGMALSRNSQDPKACALLKKIEPSAVCVK